MRTKNDLQNPTLPGGVYGKYITIGRAVYWRYDGSRTLYVIFIADGGRYGMDSIESVEFNGAIQSTSDWIFHPGTLTKQIAPYNIAAMDTGTDVLTVAAHPFNNADLVRFGIIDGVLTANIDPDLKYYIADKTVNTFKVKDVTGTTYIDFTSVGTGQMVVWKADAGFDDPVQGLPTFVPEVLTTFSHIGYVEGRLPSGVSSAEAPNWDLFRFLGLGRRLMDYDETGVEIGLLPIGDGDLSNVGLQIVDNCLTGHQLDLDDRWGWQSWRDMRDAADVLVWQRVVDSDAEPVPSGFVGRYYNSEDFTDLIITRTDLTIDMGGTGSDQPAPGVETTDFSIRWTGTIEPLYTELYTFSLEHDNTVKLFVDGVQILYEIDLGTHTVSMNLITGQSYDIQIDFVQLYFASGNPWECRFAWSSPSQAFQIVPSSATAPTDRAVKRYEDHAAFPIPTEASEVHERLMERIPGWDWTDDNGKIEFLAPDRPVVFTFGMDRNDDDSQATFTMEKFEKRRRPLSDRKNFLLFRFRDVERVGYPNDYVQADREDLRDLAGGEPTNDPAQDLGVATRSLAERVADFEMVIKSDPRHTYNVNGGRSAGKIRKNQKVAIRVYDIDNNFVADENAIATFHAWGTANGQNDFSLLPVPDPIYKDQPYMFTAVRNQINCGGGVVEPFIADIYYTGGLTYTWGTPTDISGVTGPAPAVAYDTLRYNPHSYLLPGFTSFQYAELRFHFSDQEPATGARVFDIRVQGVVPPELNNIDIALLVGNVAFKAYIIKHITQADVNGEILIEVENVSGFGGLINAIEAIT